MTLLGAIVAVLTTILALAAGGALATYITRKLST